MRKYKIAPNEKNTSTNKSLQLISSFCSSFISSISYNSFDRDVACVNDAFSTNSNQLFDHGPLTGRTHVRLNHLDGLRSQSIFLLVRRLVVLHGIRGVDPADVEPFETAETRYDAESEGELVEEFVPHRLNGFFS